MPPRPMPNETARLKTLMGNPSRCFCFTSHARVEMKDEFIIEADIRKVLEFGYVTWIETKKDLLWHVEGQDDDGRMIRVVIAADEIALRIKIVTTMTINTAN